ncbi:hypothetical protein AX16_001239 [Volvariella volvacea WC 439]|nr:hypothetical protein AX16_001239 [Volvariella volvacea WC 439]
MKLSLLLAPLVSAIVALAAPTEDWKYGVGWDGTVLPSSSIGTPAGNTTELGERGLEGRAVGGVYICEHLNWGAPCGYAVQPIGQCIVLGSDWKNKISSFGPDPGTICFGYSQNSCSQAQWNFVYPGDSTGGLSTSRPWNDQLTNFMCYAI